METEADRRRRSAHQGASLHVPALAVGVARCRRSRARGSRESSEVLSEAGGDRAREGDERRPSALDACHLEVDPVVTPRTCEYSCLTREEYAVRRLSWPCSQSGSFCQPSPASSRVWSRGLSWQAMDRQSGAGGSAAARVPNDVRVPRSSGMEWGHVRACTLSVPRVGLGRISHGNGGWT